MKCSRRSFLLGASSILALGQIQDLVWAADSATAGDILIVIFLRGGWDALNVLAPVDDQNYRAARSTATRITAKGEYSGIRLNNAFDHFDFQLHKKAAPLKELYDNGDLAFIHACGVPNGTRSHFDAQSLIERGTGDDNVKTLRSGWLTRHLRSINARQLIPAVSTSGLTPESLQGFNHACTISDIGSFTFPGDWRYGEEQKKILQSAYSGDSPLFRAGRSTLSLLNYVSSRVKRDKDGNALPYQPGNRAVYPKEYNEGLCNSLQLISRMIRMNIGLQIGLVDFDGWDTHQNQLYLFPGQLEALSRALHAFYQDLSDIKNRVSVAVMSEFGRRLKENESGGTDHGHGSLMMVLGGNVNGGKVYGSWPGLDNRNLDQGADLQVTTDYRSVLVELVAKRLGNPHTDAVFPSFARHDLNVFRV